MMGNPFFGGMTERGMRAQMEAWRYLYPDRYNSIVNELASMDRESCVAKLRQVAQEKGIDLDRMAAQYGVRL